MAALPQMHNISPYNLTHCSLLPSAQLSGFSSIFTDFAAAAAENLAAFCHLPVSAELLTVEQIPFSRYLRTLQPMACLVKFDSKPEKIDGLFEINAAIAYSIANQMLGGSGTMPHASHTISSLEMAMNRKLASLLLVQLSSAWEQAEPLAFTANEVFAYTRTMRPLPPQEICLTVTISLSVSQLRGQIAIIIPIRFLKGYFHHLSSPASAQKLSKIWQDLEIELTVSLGKNQLTKEEILGMRPGDILVLDQKISSPIDILAGDSIFCKAKPGLASKQHAVILSI